MEKQNNTDKIFFHGKEYFCTLDLVWQLLPYRLQYNTLRFQRAIKVRCRSTAVDQKVRSRDKCPSVAHK